MRWFFLKRILIGLIVMVFITYITLTISMDKGKALFILGISISIIFSFIIAILISITTGKEINNLNELTKRLASGDFSAKVTIGEKGSLREFAYSFNLMVEKMRMIFNDLSARTEELNIILSSIQEGVLVLNNKGQVLLYNDGFRKTFNIISAENRFYWEIIRDPNFGGIVERTIKEKNNFIEEISLKDKVFLCGANFLKNKEEIVITLYDITEIRNLEKIKRDFIANLSHELRTPLTSIKGFAESLDCEVTENGKHYLDIILRNTNRLINIVKDLLLLSELEGKDVALELQEVKLDILIDDVLKIFEQKAKEKNLEINFNPEENIPIIKGDPFKIEQMLINLLENAIKYTEKGYIDISLKQNDNNIIIEIQDTGIGIPESHLNRIFERFYVVDKSRSRKLGGTGLGLSIVKHIVLLHNGKIDVDSSYGLGTKFTIILPKSLGNTT